MLVAMALHFRARTREGRKAAPGARGFRLAGLALRFVKLLPGGTTPDRNHFARRRIHRRRYDGADALRGTPERVSIDMGISRRCGRLRMPEQLSDDRQPKARACADARVSVAQIMDPYRPRRQSHRRRSAAALRGSPRLAHSR
jgi:hypothetical protein